MIKSHRFPAVSSWPTRVMSTAVFTLFGASVVLVAGPVRADTAPPIVNEQFSDFAPAIAELRWEAGQFRRDVVAANMLLTGSESAQFWPLYDQYRAERQKIGDRKVRLISDFLAERNSMSEDQARALVKENFAIEKQEIELKDKWYGKMTKVLSERTVARFFHIDQKLDTAGDLALDATIPLVH